MATTQKVGKAPLRSVALRKGFSAPAPRSAVFKAGAVTTRLPPKPPGKRSAVFVAAESHRTPASPPIVTRTPVGAVVHSSSDRPPSPALVVKTPPEVQPLQDPSSPDLPTIIGYIGTNLQSLDGFDPAKVVTIVATTEKSTLEGWLKGLDALRAKIYAFELKVAAAANARFNPPKPTPA